MVARRLRLDTVDSKAELRLADTAETLVVPRLAAMAEARVDLQEAMAATPEARRADTVDNKPRLAMAAALVAQVDNQVPQSPSPISDLFFVSDQTISVMMI